MPNLAYSWKMLALTCDSWLIGVESPLELESGRPKLGGPVGVDWVKIAVSETKIILKEFWHDLHQKHASLFFHRMKCNVHYHLQLCKLIRNPSFKICDFANSINFHPYWKVQIGYAQLLFFLSFFSTKSANFERNNSKVALICTFTNRTCLTSL